MRRPRCRGLATLLLVGQAGAHLRSLPHLPRPVIGPFDSMQSMLCWSREHLVEHERCMNWMITTCEDQSTGHGTCAELKDYISKVCMAPGENQVLACGYSKDLRVATQKPAAPAQLHQIAATPELEKAAVAEEQAKPAKAAVKEDAESDVGVPSGLMRAMPSPSPAPSPTPRPTPAPAVPPPSPRRTPRPTPRQMLAPTVPPQPKVILGKAVPDEGLPDQGYDGHSKELVYYRDGESHTSDWGDEWPRSKQTEGQTTETICVKYPRLDWCKLYLKDRKILRLEGRKP